MDSTEARVRALDETTLGWLQRGVWAICVAVYLAVFVGGIQAGGAELITMGRAVGFTLAAAVLGRVLLGLLSKALLAAPQGLTAEQDGPLGSLVDLASSTNVAQQSEDEALAA
ncbi:MAG TPA: hypothetical protein VGQ62_09885 [Chloroflexota bacterium]|nr:hypothetical protein [Chloroflexota bacterium]